MREAPVRPAVGRTVAPRPPVEFPKLEPIIAGEPDGLEVSWYTADDTDHAVARALAPYVQSATPLNSVQERAWEANGLRIVRVDEKDIARILMRAHPVGELKRNWHGWITEWTEVYRGRRAGGDAALLLDGRPERLEAGFLRLISRAWSAPSPSGPVLRFELAVQLYQPRAVDPIDVFRAPTVLGAEQQGTIFRQLSFDAPLPRGSAYVITAERPGVVWSVDAPEREGTESSGSAGAIGPRAAPLQTIGERMLTAPDEAGAGTNTRAIIFILPRVPERFRLLPDAP